MNTPRRLVVVQPYRRRPELFYLWLPGAATIVWTLLTLFLYVNGPFDWLNQPHDKLIRYVTVAMAFFAAGYALGLVKKSRPAVVERPPLRILQISGVLVCLPLFSAVITGDLFRWIMMARSNIGEAYRAWTAAGGTSIWPYLDIFTAPITAPFIPLSVFHWRRLPRLYKFLFLAAVSIMLAATVTSGRRSGAINVLMTIIAILAVRTIGEPKAARTRHLRQFVLVVLVITALMLPFLRYVAEGRAGLFTDLRYNPVTREFPDPRHILTRTIPPEWAPTFFTGVFYVTHGYFPLEQALEMPFNGITYGLGQSWFLARNAERLGVPSSFLNERAYDRRLTIERGYVVGDFWMTMFPWFASDLTFPGTWFFMAFFGYVLARVWESAATTANPWSITFVAVLAHFAFSVPLSNPMQDGAGLSRTVGVFLFWALSMFVENHRRALRAERAARAPALTPAGGGAAS